MKIGQLQGYRGSRSSNKSGAYPTPGPERELIALDRDLDHAVLDLTWGHEPAFLEEMREVASSYADQVALDWAAFRDSL